VRLLFRAHGIGAALVGIPQPRLLLHAASFFDHVNLALDFIFKRIANELKLLTF